MKNLSSQGETSGCKEDELRKKRDEDKDDDPNAPRDSELPSSSAKFGTLATSQGESGKDVGGSGENPQEIDEVEAEKPETIEAILGIDDLLDLEDDNDEGGLEEGEFMPIDVPNWKSDEEKIDDVEMDINEHIVIDQTMTDVIHEDGEGDVLIDLEEIKSRMNNESLPFESAGNESEVSHEELKKLWFKKIPETEEISFKKEIQLQGVEN